jgi:membrane-associated phospholipid phosphatase
VSFMNKYTLYDWYGYNQQLFKTINHLYVSPAYDSGMLFLTYVFDADNYPYFMMALMAYAMISAVYRRLRGIGDHKGKRYLARWTGVLVVLAVAFVAMGLTVKNMKSDFAYPRPYVALPSDDVRLLEKHAGAKNDHRSFPSGHAAFITLLIAGLWPVLSRDIRLLGVLLVSAVCWSRLAVGAHFPADVLAGFLIALIIVLIVRRFVYWLFDTLFGLEC